MTPLEYLERMWAAQGATDAAFLELYFHRTQERRRHVISVARRLALVVGGTLGALVLVTLLLAVLVVGGVLP